MNAPLWADSQPGAHFTGVDLDAGRWDPYWVLGDASGYRDYINSAVDGQAIAPDVRLPALVEMAEGHTADSLRTQAPGLVTVPAIYRDQAHCTAWIEPGFLAATLPGGVLEGRVQRLELGLPLVAAGTMRSWPQSKVGASAKLPGRIVFGVIDTGCAYAHRSLRGAAPGSTRVRCIWDQESDPGKVAFRDLHAPADLGYGREAWRVELQAWMARAGSPLDESRCYELAGYDLLRRGRSHGMHVLDLLCGPMPLSSRMVSARDGTLPNWRIQQDAAASADVIFVQLPRGALEDASGGWLCVHVLDALRYIVARTEPDEHVIVNLSYGSQLGPHDGSTTLEAAIKALVDEVGRLSVVFSAGNSFDRRAHAQVRLQGGMSHALTWHLPPDNASAAYAEIWWPADSAVTVELTPPAGTGPSSGPVGVDRCIHWSPTGPMPLAEVCHLSRTACGDGQLTLLRVGPTEVSRRSAIPLAAPSGDWTVTLRSIDPEADPVEVHLYLSRNDPDLDQVRGARNAHWNDGDRGGLLRPLRDDPAAWPAPAPVVRRRGTLNWCFPLGKANAAGDPAVSAWHPRLYVIGGHVLRPEPSGEPLSAHPPYASAGPSRAVGHIGLRASAASDESPALSGLRAAGTRSGGSFRLIGTSVAAPQYARLLALNGAVPPVGGNATLPVELFGQDGRFRLP